MYREEQKGKYMNYLLPNIFIKEIKNLYMEKNRKENI